MYIDTIKPLSLYVTTFYIIHHTSNTTAQERKKFRHGLRAHTPNTKQKARAHKLRQNEKGKITNQSNKQDASAATVVHTLRDPKPQNPNSNSNTEDNDPQRTNSL